MSSASLLSKAKNFYPEIFLTGHHSPGGVPYLKESGVVLLQMPEVNLNSIERFLGGFDRDLHFDDYLDDPVKLDPVEGLLKFAGQLCYMSLGPDRTKNAEAAKYFDNIKSSGHGSVLEHAQFTFLVYGISRSLTHELVRHRAGVAYSQLSQRYVDGSKLRFVERPEFQNHEMLHRRFENYIDQAKVEYDNRAELLMSSMTFPEDLNRRDRRKLVNQAARSCLPNETEAPIVFSANVRALRHILEMRCSGPAEREIRDMTHKLFQCLQSVTTLFSDYEVVDVPQGGKGLVNKYRKV